MKVDDFCEQCGEPFEDEDEVVISCFNHWLHEYCVDDYLYELEKSFERFTYQKEDVEGYRKELLERVAERRKNRTEEEEMYDDFIEEEIKFLNGGD